MMTIRPPVRGRMIVLWPSLEEVAFIVVIDVDSEELKRMRRLYRSETNRKIAGVCGGIGEHLDIDPTIVRLISVVFAIATGILPFLIGYLVAWWIVPPASKIEARS